ncbi:MAG: (2Fe-2S) ferredoxin domain-containing protein [Anaerolineae bacterium]|jgi:(2Fe-2S) ferredoxin|nr:(2Fe-2S) ferredoxin domain-containing protein [Anaerolineae bacterium]
MNAIKSLDDLQKIRDAALAKRKLGETSGSKQVIVGMGTCGIAAGARETMKSVLDFIEANNLENVVVTQTGCIGLCEQEPIMQVVMPGQEKVTYGKVDAEVAKKIMKEHVTDGKVVQGNVITI